MEEKIIEFIKNSKNHVDGIDISIGLKIYIPDCYRLLHEMETNGLITKHWFGISTYFTINN